MNSAAKRVPIPPSTAAFRRRTPVYEVRIVRTFILTLSVENEEGGSDHPAHKDARVLLTTVKAVIASVEFRPDATIG